MDQNLSSLLGCAVASYEMHAFTSNLGTAETIEYGDLYIWSYPTHGIELTFGEDMKLRAVTLFASGFQGHTGYKKSLPKGLTFSESKEEVRNLLGIPQHCFERRSATNRILPAVDRFDFEDHSLHVQYGDNGTIERIVVRQKTS